MKSSTLYRWLEWTFQPQTCTEVFPVIGLQEDNTEEITRVYTATFASPEVFEQLERLDANTCMLFTHHPKPQRLNTADPPPQIPQKWLDFLKERHISLFTYHIPLDRNSPFSPGVNLARALGAEPYDSFFEQNLVRMGVVCTSPFSTATELAQAMERVVGHAVKLYSYAEDVLSRGRFAYGRRRKKHADLRAAPRLGCQHLYNRRDESGGTLGGRHSRGCQGKRRQSSRRYALFHRKICTNANVPLL